MTLVINTALLQRSVKIIIIIVFNILYPREFSTVGLKIIIIIIIIIIIFIYGAVIMTESHCESSPSSHDECRTVPDGYRPLDQAADLRHRPACSAFCALHDLHEVYQLKGN